MWKTSRLIGSIAIIFTMIILAACGGNNDNEGNNNAANEQNNNNNGDLDLGETNIALGTDDYVSNTSNTYVAKLLLEDIGYNVDINQTDVGVEYQGLADGTNDAIVGAWLPTTHKSYWEKDEDKFEKINTVTEDVKLSLTVPEYMEDINSIEDLRDNTNNIGEDLDWEITGISPGAGEMEIMENEVMPGYDLEDDWELIESSGAAMASALGDAIEEERPIVVTLWEPHWTYNEYDLKKLDDPDERFGEPDDVFSVAGNDFEENSPAAYQLLENFSIEQEDTQEIMSDIEGGMDEEEAAQKFLDENEDLKEEWLEGLE